jgi:hypothetical protein
MSRSLLAFALGLAFALAARGARADDWKWDPSVKKATPKVGSKSYSEEEELEKQSSKVTLGAQVVQNEKHEVKTTFRLVSEVIAVDGDKVSEELVKVEKWKQEVKGDDPDTSLEGHTFRVKGTGAKKTYQIEDDKENKVSDEAKQWIQGRIEKKKSDDEEEKSQRVFFPKTPVPQDAEWKPDVAELAKVMGLPDIDLAKSSAQGKLSNVHMDHGVHFGHIEVKVTFALNLPEGKWVEGGNLDLTLAVDTSLEPDKRDQDDGKMDVEFSGKGNVTTQNGEAVVKRVLTQKRSGKSGPVE